MSVRVRRKARDKVLAMTGPAASVRVGALCRAGGLPAAEEVGDDGGGGGCFGHGSPKKVMAWQKQSTGARLAHFGAIVEGRGDSGSHCGSGVKRTQKNLAKTLNRVIYKRLLCRGVAQPGSAPASGAGGRKFESSRPDHKDQGVTANAVTPFFFCGTSCGTFICSSLSLLV